MSKWEKLLTKIKTSPNAMTYEEIESILLGLGWNCRTPRSGSSHHIFSKEGVEKIITVPYKRPHVGRCYVDRVISIIEDGK